MRLAKLLPLLGSAVSAEVEISAGVDPTIHFDVTASTNPPEMSFKTSAGSFSLSHPLDSPGLSVAGQQVATQAHVASSIQSATADMATQAHVASSVAAATADMATQAHVASSVAAATADMATQAHVASSIQSATSDLASQNDVAVAMENARKSTAFHIGGYDKTYDDAKAACEARGARLCSVGEMWDAKGEGKAWCSCGWSTNMDGTPQSTYPMQKYTGTGCCSDNLCYCGSNPASKYGANCCKGPDKTVGRNLQLNREIQKITPKIFHVGGYDKTPRQAAQACKDRGAKLCTRAELYSHWASGTQWCSCGWTATDKGFAGLYPMQPYSGGGCCSNNVCVCSGDTSDRDSSTKWGANCCN